jgi:pyridoxal 5'-phosphate synthase pdxT subunit
MVMQRIVGVLALQGAFAKHVEVIKSLKAVPILVRRPAELDKCDALIIPGGESTTISKRIDYIGLREPLVSFAREKPVFGTCAGLILLAKGTSHECDINSFGILEAAVLRNGYGTQYDSFSTTVPLLFGKDKRLFQAIFIRAPKILSTGQGVDILASIGENPILIQQGRLLAATFHPELTEDLRIHEYFLNLI